MRHRASFALIYQTVVEMWAFFDFSRWRTSAVLDLLYACLNHPRREAYLVVFVTVQNLDGIVAVVAIICKFLIF